MKKIFLIFLAVLVGAVPTYFYLKFKKGNFLEIENKIVVKESDQITKNIGFLAQFNFDNLKNKEYKASTITKIGQTLGVDEARKALVKRGDLVGKSFNFETKAISFESEGKKISGMMNLPASAKVSARRSPAIIMIRGYAENTGYYIGSGTWRAADELARNGYITVSLDFLGFGLSDAEPTDILEARFVKPINVIDLIESVKAMPEVDPNKIGIWAHSNGGQIAISVLEITGKNYPTVLWAPMTDPFPQSVLDTIDKNDPSSLIVKGKIKDFEKNYDSKLYSIDNYYQWINSPILLHQGTADTQVKLEWQTTLRDKLNALGKNITLDIEKNNDHNFKQSWDKVMKMDVEFFNEKLK